MCERKGAKAWPVLTQAQGKERMLGLEGRRCDSFQSPFCKYLGLRKISNALTSLQSHSNIFDKLSNNIRLRFHRSTTLLFLRELLGRGTHSGSQF